MTRGDHPTRLQPAATSCARALEVRNLVAIVLVEDLAETDRQFSQVRAGISRARARTETTIAGNRLSLLSPESCMRAGVDDIATYRHG